MLISVMKGSPMNVILPFFSIENCEVIEWAAESESIAWLHHK